MLSFFCKFVAIINYIMRKILLLFFVLLFSIQSRASHFVGGDITWECISDPTSLDFGKFIFQLKAYGDCTGIDFGSAIVGGSESLTVHGHPTINDISLIWNTTNDISSVGTPGVNPCYNCSNAPAGVLPGFVIEEHIYRSLPISLGNGNIPDPTGAVWNQLTNEYDVLPLGWHFTWGSGARNAADNMTSTGNWLLRAVMYPYTKNTSIIPFVYEDAFPCYDSSPLFKEQAKTLMCTNVPFSYSHLAFDINFDSLAYSWAYPLDGSSGTYNPADPTTFGMMTFSNTTNGGVYDFSVTQQIPSNPAFPLELNAGTGEISFMNDQLIGAFVTCVRVRSVKCSQPIADVFREVQVVATATACNLASGVVNSPPTITQPVGTQIWTQYINSAGLPSYRTEVMAGELVEFDVIASDIDMQNITLEVEGSQLDLSLALSNPATFVNTNSVPGITEGKFSWYSSCDHLVIDSCAGAPNQSFNFNLKAYDDFCPANGTTVANITIDLIPPTPDLRCLAVEPNGDVELSWYYPSGLTNAVLDYDVYCSKNYNGPYSDVGDVSYPDSTFMHINAGADTASSFYYMIANGVCVGASIANTVDSISDTLRSIYLDAGTVNSTPIFAYLDWNHMRINNDVATQNEYLYNVATTEKLYSLFYEYNVANGFDSIAEYSDTIGYKRSDYCNYDPRFYIEIADKRGCISRSSIATTHLVDDVPPEIPIIKDVSVDLNGKSVISWQPSVGAELYAVYIQDSNAAWITLDTVFYPDSTFIYQSSNANENFETFSVRALDSCENTLDASLAHNSIHLNLELDACEHTFDLNWNEYINWINGLGFYRVTVEEIDLNGVVNSNSFHVDSSNTSFLVVGLIDKYTYIIYVDAFNVDSTFSAHSNEIQIVPDLPKRPDFNYIDYVSVNHDDGSVEINCLVDNTAIINHYDILRSLRFSDEFVKIGSILFDASNMIHFNDNEAKTQSEFYQYEVYPVDTCGVRVPAPPVNLPAYLNDTSFGQTILLECVINIDYTDDPTLDGEYTNTLSFNEYDRWLGSVSEYRLYRSVNREPFDLLPIHVWDRVNKPNETLEYIDVVTEFGDGNGRFCYYIEAIEGFANPYGSVSEGSFSNISCVSQTPIIFVPSVFTPNGDEHNEVFRPITYYVSETGYSFTIFNRKGTELFTTNDPQKGWDGTFINDVVMQGTYVYHLKFLNGIGNLTEKTGTITIIR